jgi:hypothetical protein
MSWKNEDQWAFGGELFESRNWVPDPASLGVQWRSAASLMLQQYAPASDRAGAPATVDKGKA